MAYPDPTAPPAIDAEPSPPTRPPRATANTSVPVMLDAVVGLTSPCASTSPNTTKISPSPSIGGEQDAMPQAPSSAVQGTQRYAAMIAKATLTNPGSHPEVTAMAVSPSSQPSGHCRLTVLQPYSERTATTVAARPSDLHQPPTRSSQIRPLPTSFDAHPIPINPRAANAAHSTSPTVPPSSGERVAAPDRVAALAARTAAPPCSTLPAPSPLRPAPPPTALDTGTKNFPEALYDLLSSQAHADVIAWLPHGRGFRIRDKQRFADSVMPRYFDSAKFTSFTRRLKRWNFTRVPRGPEIGAYYSQHVVRGRPDLVHKLRCCMGRKFERVKKKSQDGKENDEESEEDESMEEQTNEERTNMETQAKALSPEPSRQQEDLKPRPNQVLPAEILSQNTKGTDVTNPQNLPAVLLQRPKAVQEAATNHSLKATGPLRNYPSTANAKPPPFPRAYPTPNAPWPNNSDDQLLMEMQRELVLARVISKSVASRALLGHAGNPLRSATALHLPGQPSMAERMFNAQCAERTLKAKQVRALDSSILQQHVANINNINQEALIYNFLGPLQNGERLSNAMHDMQSRMASPFAQLSEHALLRSSGYTGYESSACEQIDRRTMSLPPDCNPFAKLSSGEAPRTARAAHCGDGRRTVVMSEEEEKEFAAYLFLKRSAA